MPRVLFVCLGNICRSPLAEAILRHQATEANLDVEVDSAGTGNWHIGERSDRRAIAIGEGRGYEMNHCARQVSSADFQRFDLIVAMDHANVSELVRWDGAEPYKIKLARSFDPAAADLEVPDPYYGGDEGFEEVADQLEQACRGILAHLRDHTA